MASGRLPPPTIYATRCTGLPLSPTLPHPLLKGLQSCMQSFGACAAHLDVGDGHGVQQALQARHRLLHCIRAGRPLALVALVDLVPAGRANMQVLTCLVQGD